RGEVTLGDAEPGRRPVHANDEVHDRREVDLLQAEARELGRARVEVVEGHGGDRLADREALVADTGRAFEPEQILDFIIVEGRHRDPTAGGMPPRYGAERCRITGVPIVPAATMTIFASMTPLPTDTL